MPQKRSRLGTVRKLESGRWQARWSDPDTGPSKAPHTFPTKRDATAYLVQVEHAILTGTTFGNAKGRATVADFIGKWIETGGSRGQLAPRSREEYRDNLDRLIAPTALGKLPLYRVRVEDVREWHRVTGEHLAASAQRRGGTGQTKLHQAYRMLSAAMNSAVDGREIQQSPCVIRPKAPVRHDPQRMTANELMRLRDAMTPAYAWPAFALQLGAFLRPGEICGLERRDYSAETGILRVERQIVTLRDGGQQVSTTKTGARRDVPLPMALRRILDDYLATIPRGLPRAPLLVNTKGGRLTVSALGATFRKAAEQAGLRGGLTLYSGKHTGLSWLGDGQNLDAVRKAAGHSTVSAAMAYQIAAADSGERLSQVIDVSLFGALEVAREAPSTAGNSA